MLWWWVVIDRETVLLSEIHAIIHTEAIAMLEHAVVAAKQSPCKKSQRGAVIWKPGDAHFIAGWNHQPAPFSCDGSPACRAACGKLCVHAEAHALLRSGNCRWFHMIHVEVVDGEAVPSGGPSCWQCSRLILEAGIERMWLLHRSGLVAYTAEEFHRLTLACQIS